MANYDDIIQNLKIERANQMAHTQSAASQQGDQGDSITEERIIEIIRKHFMSSAGKNSPNMPPNISVEAEEIQDPNVPKIIQDLVAGNPAYLYGVAGTGKTYIADAIVKMLGRGFEKLNCTQFTPLRSIIGGQTIEGYEEGAVIKAWRDGKILIIDELPKLDPNTAGALNEALAKTADQIPENVTDPDKDIPYIMNGAGQKILKGGGDRTLAAQFGVIATGNTDLKSVPSNFSGNNRQDYSLFDRFAGSFYKVTFPTQTAVRICAPAAYRIGVSLLNFLVLNPDRMESISLRTMLNFSRTYTFSMFAKNQSCYKAIGSSSSRDAKKLLDAFESFVATLSIDDQTKIAASGMSKFAKSEDSELEEFEQWFIATHLMRYNGVVRGFKPNPDSCDELEFRLATVAETTAAIEATNKLVDELLRDFAPTV